MAKEKETITPRQRLVQASLDSWITLNKHIVKFTAEDVVYALGLENRRSGGPRATILRRLRQRYNAARAEEIMRELDS